MRLFLLLDIVGDNNQCNGAQNNQSGNNDCQLGKQLINALALVLAEKGLSTAGDRTGEASILCGLEKNHNSKSYGKCDQHATQNILKNFHYYIPPKTISYLILYELIVTFHIIA